MIKKIIYLFGFILASYNFVYADISATIKTDPEFPEPKSIVSVSMESYSFDVNTANFSWKVNDKNFLSGLGEKTIRITTGNIGQKTKVSVIATTAGGEQIEQLVNITPSSVLLLYESPKSYTPLFYEGRSLVSDDGIFKVVAFPQISDKGVPVPPSSLSYVWYVDDEIFQDVSGTGKQSANFRFDFLKEKMDITVVIRSPLGNKASKTITIYPHDIMPLLYINDPLLGNLFTKLLTGRFEAISDFSLILEPFYVSHKESKTPTYSWFLNGLPSTPMDGRTLSFQPKENSYGTKMLSIEVKGPDKRIQKGETKVELVFDTRK